MKLISSSLICFTFMFSNYSVFGDEKEIELTNYQKAMRGLSRKEIRADLPAEKMLDLCIPTSKRTLGRFTEYDYEMLPGYHGLTIIAKNGLLKRATVWSCTYTQTYFNELTPDDEKQYQKLRIDNVDVPSERFIGRWGWDRPRMRDWKRDSGESGGASNENERKWDASQIILFDKKV